MFQKQILKKQKKTKKQSCSAHSLKNAQQTLLSHTECPEVVGWIYGTDKHCDNLLRITTEAQVAHKQNLMPLLFPTLHFTSYSLAQFHFPHPNQTQSFIRAHWSDNRSSGRWKKREIEHGRA